MQKFFRGPADLPEYRLEEPEIFDQPGDEDVEQDDETDDAPFPTDSDFVPVDGDEDEEEIDDDDVEDDDADYADFGPVSQVGQHKWWNR